MTKFLPVRAKAGLLRQGIGPTRRGTKAGVLTYHRDDLGTFGLRVLRGCGRCIVRLEGEVGLNACPVLDRVLRDLCDAGELRVDIDLRRVSYVSPRAVLVILAAQGRLTDAGGTLSVFGGPQDARRTVEQLGLAG